MDFPSSIKKSFKSHGSYKHMRKISAAGNDNIYYEKRPILSDHCHVEDHHRHHCSDMNDRCEVIVKIDGCVDDDAVVGNKTWPPETHYEYRNKKDSGGESFYFHPGKEVDIEDPASTLVGRFLVNQREHGQELFDVDTKGIEMSEKTHNNTRKSPLQAESPVHSHRVSASREVKVSFQAPSLNAFDVQPERSSDDDEEEEEDEIDKGDDKTGSQQQFHNSHRSPSFSSAADNGGGEVLRCTSFQMRQTMLRRKTKSRLADPPQDPRSG
ncbi:hypothetical protein RHGRI_013333 [Rhododendron griersonianum]|uniref:Uncharacterized protein n=1 Tax=Rhododendron griersonianum TaxID=479676 RepID=A0AAV6K5D8_9ERIC|nr:hypothetical protein RHGRI_013333 [Rhododendron griersonianum]